MLENYGYRSHYKFVCTCRRGIRALVEYTKLRVVEVGQPLNLRLRFLQNLAPSRE